MNKVQIKKPLKGRVKISGFKSLDNFEIENIEPFMVFAGPNASGKSNLIDAFRFASSVINTGAKRAIKEFGGFKSVHCRKRKKEYRKTFTFEIDWPIKNKAGELTLTKYHLKVQKMDSTPTLYEKLTAEGEIIFERDGKTLKKVEKDDNFLEPFLQKYIKDDQSILIYGSSHTNIISLLGETKKFAFDPNAAREPNKAEASDVELDQNGKNLAAVLSRIEKEDKPTTQEICDLMAHLVPSIKEFKTEESRLDTSVSLNFREIGHASLFPPGLISDGTVYILCILVAALTSKKETELKLIEEPERGIHPKAVEELSKLLQDSATWDTPVFLTTHSESIIRTCKTESIVFLNKSNGITKGTAAALPPGIKIPLDEAWLTNMLNGGLPW